MRIAIISDIHANMAAALAMQMSRLLAESDAAPWRRRRRRRGQGAAVSHRAVRTVFSARSVIRNEGGARKAAVQETAVQKSGIISTSGVL